MGQGALLSVVDKRVERHKRPAPAVFMRPGRLPRSEPMGAAAPRRRSTVRSAVRVACGRNPSSSSVPLRFLCRRPRRALARGFEARQQRTGGGEVFPGSNGWGPGSVAGRSRGRASSDRPIVACWDWVARRLRASMAGVATLGSGGVQGVVSIPVISRGAPADVRGRPKSFRRISVGIGNGIHHAGDVLRPVPQILGLRWQRLGSYRTPRIGVAASWPDLRYSIARAGERRFLNVARILINGSSNRALGIDLDPRVVGRRYSGTKGLVHALAASPRRRASPGRAARRTTTA